MKHNHHPFENQIFAHFRDQEDKIAEAIKLLKKTDIVFTNKKSRNKIA